MKILREMHPDGNESNVIIANAVKSLLKNLEPELLNLLLLHCFRCIRTFSCVIHDSVSAVHRSLELFQY